MILKQLAFKTSRRNQSPGHQALEVNEPPTHSKLGRMIAIGLTALILYAIGTGFGLLAQPFLNLRGRHRSTGLPSALPCAICRLFRAGHKFAQGEASHSV